MIPRILTQTLIDKLNDNKLVVLRGPRKSGRLTLLKTITDLSATGVLVLDGEMKKVRKGFDNLESFRELSQGKSLIVIREAQLFASLQAIIDECLENKSIFNVILLCSFEPSLQEDLWEALRFQGLELTLYPLTYTETAQSLGLAQEEKHIEQRLIYGYYPEIVMHPDEVEQRLYDILESSVFTQLGATERINKKEKLIKLLRLLAFHIGKVISYNELGKQCDLDNETVERYVSLFEKADLLFQLTSFNNGHRYELKKSHVVYFVDNGIRNALIRAFQPFEYRNDIPELWRNWVISERRKANKYANRTPETFFWLTHTKQEVDYIEIAGETAIGYKMQWDKKRAIKIPSSFQEAYPTIKVTGVNRSTFWTFIQKK